MMFQIHWQAVHVAFYIFLGGNLKGGGGGGQCTDTL